VRLRWNLAPVADVLVPWGTGVLLALIAIDAHIAPLLVLLGIALAAVQGVALHWRRRRPELVMAITLLAAAGFFALVPDTVIPFAPLFAIHSLAATRPPRVSLPGLVGLEALCALNFLTTNVGDTTFTMALAVGSWALGEAARNRRVAISEEARRAVSEEQARIARELHDVIAHSVSVIVVQAAAADDVFDERPDQARAALRSIEHAGRDALGELRRLLSAVQAADPRGPQPGLDRLDELAAPLRAGGLDVVVRREGEPAALPAGVDLSAYRIVQEALTNTLRHARATSAEVVVTYEDDAVEVDVRDDGRAAADGSGGTHSPSGSGTSGRGLVGMRERAALVGGTLEAGPQPGGGYRVHARLPTGSSP